MDLVAEREHFRNRLSELRDVARIGSPWIFVCASAYVEYLARLEKGSVTSGDDYIEFVKQWLAKVNPAYKAFTFKSGMQDLPEQMYLVLRCGVVHSLSLVPSQGTKGGRPRPIVLAHHANAAQGGLRH